MARSLWLLAAACAACVVASTALPRRTVPAMVPAPPAPHAAAGDRSYRLPGEAMPLHYDITIAPYLEEMNLAFEGIVDISIKVRPRSTRDHKDNL